MAWWWWRCVVTLVACSSLASAQGLTACSRAPAGSTLPKRPGDNGFSIKISGNPQKYVPLEVYTVSLKGVRVGYSVQRFTAFLLVVEATSAHINIFRPQSFGTFTLFPDALTMYDDDCPNAITQTSSLTKTEVQVLWTAPPAGSGCVRFRAMVVESRDVWYMDDGELTKELCEEVQESDDHQPDVIRDCSACDEAKYEVTFEGLWSRQTHPKDFPTNEWLTHFSDIIGASHSVDYHVWVAGEHASDGLKQVAEWGSTRELESELKRQSDHIRTIIKARGLWHPNVNGKTFAVFRVDNRHHLMSLVSMLGPTPDWIVGVSALELCQANGTWIPQKTLNLYPYDAGTDSGITYESANMPSIPREKIRRITTGYPNDPDAPFYDPTGEQMKPLARLTITRQRVYQKSCSDTRLLDSDFPGVSIVETSDEDADRMECQVTSWSEFTPCSVTCGKGLRQRSRNYIMPPKAQMMGCRRQLMEKEMCAGEQNFCAGDPGGAFSNPGHFDPRVCTTSDWGPWTPCSETCGPGIRMRNRRYLDRMGRKKCNKELVQKEMCIADVPRCENTQEEIIPPECQVTEWTDFSPCSATCGQGTTTRTRSYLVPAANQDQCSVNIMDRKPCQGERQDCSVDLAEAEEVCMQEKIVGPCRGYFHRFYFDKNTHRCKEFTYGGCHGNRNNFETHDECTRVCEFNKDVLMMLTGNGGDPSLVQPTTVRDPGLQPLPHHNRPGGLNDVGVVGGGGLVGGPNRPPSANHRVEQPDRVNCLVSPWSTWGQCSSTCGRSVKYRVRTIETHPQNGGKRCPRKMKRQRKCKTQRCRPNNDFGGLESRSLHRDPLPGESFLPAPSRPPPPPPPYRPMTPSPHNPYPDTEYIAPGLFNPPTNFRGPGDANLNFNSFQEGPTVDCEMSEWGPWSPCTHSCGPESLQQRSRLVVTAPRGGGVECGDRNQRRYCNLPPCHRPRSQHGPWSSVTGGDTWQP